MDPEPQVITGPASPPSPSDAHQISSDPEPDADDWDDEQRRFPKLDEIDWDEINNEVEAAMNESDDDDDDDGDADGKSVRSARSRSGVKSGNASEDEGIWTDETDSIIG